MSSPQDRDQLRDQFQHLQDDWNSYKKSLTRLPCRRSSLCPSSSSSSLPTTPTTTTSTYVAKSNFFDIIHDSPKQLVSSLQHPTTLPPPSTSPSPVSSPEKKPKRRPAYSGRLLLDELERAKDDSHDDDGGGGDEKEGLTGLLYSGGSSTVVHGASEGDSPTTDDDGCYCSSCVGECDCCYCSSPMVLRRVGRRLPRQQIERLDSSSSSCSSADEVVEAGDSSSPSSSPEDEGVEGGDSSSSSSSSEDEGEEGGDGCITRLVKLTGLCISLFVVLLPLGFLVLSENFGFQERRVPPPT